MGMSLNYLVTYYAFETTKTVLWWGGTQILYLVTPPMVWGWAFPKKTETEKLLDELRMVREELRELNKKKISEEQVVELENTVRGIVERIRLV